MPRIGRGELGSSVENRKLGTTIERTIRVEPATPGAGSPVYPNKVASDKDLSISLDLWLRPKTKTPPTASVGPLR
jgi:hypothetical protein